MGFTEAGETMVYEGNSLRILNRGIKLTEDALDPIKCKFMSPDELEKHQRIQANARAYADQKAKEKVRIDEAERIAKYDRIEKNAEEVVDSKGNELKFGAEVKRFEGKRG